MIKVSVVMFILLQNIYIIFEYYSERPMVVSLVQLVFVGFLLYDGRNTFSRRLICVDLEWKVLCTHDLAKPMKVASLSVKQIDKNGHNTTYMSLACYYHLTYLYLYQSCSILYVDRRINFNEFLPILKEVAKNKDTSQSGDFIEGFKVFDKEQNGTIGTAELRHLLSTLGLQDNFVFILLSLYDIRSGYSDAIQSTQARLSFSND